MAEIAGLDPRHLYDRVRLNTYTILAEGGYLDRVSKRGSDLERWRRYLEKIGRPEQPPPTNLLAQPTIFPMMEDLPTMAWRDAKLIAASAILEKMFPVIRAEIDAADVSKFIRYESIILAGGKWAVMPVYVFGADTCKVLYKHNPFPETSRILQELPGACPMLPLADAAFSAHGPHTRLIPHCSWDPFRLRLHLGLHIPGNCGIRVGTETRYWSEGKVLAFHDSFEHETYNDSGETRIVLIVDLWHPDLTPIERQAILGCFRKKEIRRALMQTRAPSELQPVFDSEFLAAEANDPLLAEYWNYQA